MHGYLDYHHGPTGFTMDQLSGEQYETLLQFVDKYFAGGYEYFTPIALRVEDRQRLEERYRIG